MTIASLLYILLGFAILAVVGTGLVLWLGAPKRRALAAALKAQIARDSDELNLDQRLGEKQFVEFDSASGEPAQIKMAYRQTGHGPDLVCLHGIGASMMIYRRLVPWLSGDYRVTCFDFPGFGSSDKPRSLSYSLDEQARHLKAAIEALGIENPLVLGSSMGGAIALNAARLFPELFRGVMALAPAVDPKRVPLVLLPLAKLSDHLHRMNTLATIRPVVQQVIARRELITPALVALYQEPFRDKGDSSSAFLKAFSLLADPRMPRLFSEIKTPLLIVRGLRDRLVKQSACEDLSRLVLNSKLITHPNAGHHIMEDEPEFVALETRKFDTTIR